MTIIMIVMFLLNKTYEMFLQILSYQFQISHLMQQVPSTPIQQSFNPISVSFGSLGINEFDPRCHPFLGTLTEFLWL